MKQKKKSKSKTIEIKKYPKKVIPISPKTCDKLAKRISSLDAIEYLVYEINMNLCKGQYNMWSACPYNTVLSVAKTYENVGWKVSCSRHMGGTQICFNHENLYTKERIFICPKKLEN